MLRSISHAMKGVILVAVVATAVALAARAVWRYTGTDIDRRIIRTHPSARVAELGNRQFAPSAAVLGSPDEVTTFVEHLQTTSPPDLGTLRNEKLARAFSARLAALLNADYPAFGARCMVEGYVLDPELQASASKVWREAAAAMKNWRVDLSDVQITYRSDPRARPTGTSLERGELETRSAMRTKSGELLPKFSETSRANAPRATVRVAVQYPDPDTAQLRPAYVGYDFRWNQTAEEWVAVSSNSMGPTLYPPVRPPVLPLF